MFSDLWAPLFVSYVSMHVRVCVRALLAMTHSLPDQMFGFSSGMCVWGILGASGCQIIYYAQTPLQLPPSHPILDRLCSGAVPGA